MLDAAEIALCLAREEYPNLDVEAYLGEVAALAHDVRPRLRGGLFDPRPGGCVASSSTRWASRGTPSLL